MEHQKNSVPAKDGVIAELRERECTLEQAVTKATHKTSLLYCVRASVAVVAKWVYVYVRYSGRLV